MIGWQILLSGIIVFLIVMLIDVSNDGAPRWLRVIGGMAVLAVPIGALIQIWQ